ncbi:MAG: response regulator transcription factor [Ktedonobacteraceae bacterium]|nr:response regulator transcription factor [Ktedonobacteraceae bacterium]MBO0793001.1 response regulator transcription factor [Ktedonobacteraceae bacterium]
MKILLVDDDHDFIEMLVGLLKAHGYEVCTAYTEERTRLEWEKQRPDLVILDTTLNGSDTATLCREMRRHHNALVMVITEDHDIHQEVRSLESGADDYLRKPFMPSQFLAHIRSVSRRGISSLTSPPSARISIGPLEIDSLNHEVTLYGRTIRLTPTESKILYLLAVNANTVCTAGQIISYVWGANNGDNYLVKAHIYHLRQKIEANPRKPYYILTAPGIGYRLLRQANEERSEEVVRSLRMVSR